MKLFPILVLFLTTKLLAQQSPAVPIVEKLNQKITAIQKGSFECRYIWKSLMNNDSTSNFGRTYFFKSQSDKDSIGLFLVEMPSKTRRGYDGETFYYINDEQRTILARPVSEKGGVSKFLSAGILSELAFRNYIYGNIRPPFLPQMFEDVLLDTISDKERKYILLTKLDSFPNPLKVTLKDPNMSQVRQEFEVSLPSLDLLCKREWVYIGTRFQYIEQNLSSILPLPESITFERLLNLDSLLDAGYSMVSRKEKSISPLVKVGDTIPRFSLLDLDGNLISSTNLDTGLILLDFWYKKCGPCWLSMPDVERLHNTYNRQGLRVFGINGHDTVPDELKELLKEREVTYPTLLDAQKSLANYLHITGYPTVILADAKTHRVLFAQAGLGEIEVGALSQIIEENLK
jgi:peroxiredoxin